MIILVVNGYENNRVGNASYRAYSQRAELLLKPVLRGLSYQIKHRDKRTLHDILFQEFSEFDSEAALKLFMPVDLVLAEAQCSKMPWDSNSKQLMVLIRMCLKYKKPMLLSGGLIYFLQFTICLQNKIASSQHKLAKSRMRQVQGDLCVDTQNYCVYERVDGQFKNAYTIGFSNKYIRNSQGVQIHQKKITERLVLSLGCNQIRIYPVKRCSSHPLFADVNFPLVVRKRNWVIDIQPHNLESNFCLQAENKDCYGFIYKRSLGVLWQLIATCPQSSKLLTNFLELKVNEALQLGCRIQTIDPVLTNSHRYQQLSMVNSKSSRLMSANSKVTKPSTRRPQTGRSIKKIFQKKTYQNQGPYMSSTDLMRMYEKQQRKKDIHPRSIITGSKTMIEACPLVTECGPLKSHKFREEQKKKWLFNNFIV